MLTKKEMRQEAFILANKLNAKVYDHERDFVKGMQIGQLLAYDEATTKKGEVDMHVHSAIGAAMERWGV